MVSLFIYHPARAQKIQQTGNISAITEIKVKPGNEIAVLKACARIKVEASKEPGCLEFVLNTKEGDPSTFFLFEIFKDEWALEFHKKEQHTRDFLNSIKGKYLTNEVTFLNRLEASN
jgi:quinol monooxygenase YgiN